MGFAEFRARVKTSFKIRGDFLLRFVDSEGDECDLAFEEEWNDAIEDCRDSVLRLEVVAKGDSGSPPSRNLPRLVARAV